VPHRVVLDEAHYFLDRAEGAALFDPKLGGCCLATYRSADLAPGVVDACDVIVATRIADRQRAARLLGLARSPDPSSHWIDTLAELSVGEAVLLRAGPENDAAIARFRVERRSTPHVRHRTKYVDIGVPPGREFVFTWEGRATLQRARTLRDLLETLPRVSDALLAGHLVRGDLHRWIEDVVGDRTLGEAIRSAERFGAPEARERIVRAIQERYLEQEPTPFDVGRPDAPSAAPAS
jgi:hypothetical protein